MHDIKFLQELQASGDSQDPYCQGRMNNSCQMSCFFQDIITTKMKSSFLRLETSFSWGKCKIKGLNNYPLRKLKLS